MAESALCVCCSDRERDYPALTCRRCWGRLAGALHQIPRLMQELSGLGFVQRDRRQRHETSRVPLWADPVAHALPAGPVSSPKAGPKVGGSPGRSAPIRIDPTDLLAAARRGSMSVALSGMYAQDQIGHLSVATELEFWATDWADLRNEGRPFPLVPVLCSWLLDRLEWACQCYYALDEFASDVQKLSSALYGLCGYGAARPKLMEAPCPSCHLLTLTQGFEESNIECSALECGRILTVEEYAEYVRTIIEENSP